MTRLLEELELRTMLQGDDDHRDAIVTIHPGAGGLESQDWAEMLLRMYTRWAERRGFTVSRPGPPTGGRGRNQERDPRDQGGPRLRVSEGREGSASPGAHLSLRRPVPPPHLLRLRLRVSGGGRRHRDRDRRGGPARRHLPGLRRRWPAREQDRFGGPPHPPAHGDRGVLPAGAVPAQEPEHGHEDAPGRAVRARAREQEEEKAALEATKTDIGWGNQIRSYVFHPTPWSTTTGRS